MPDVNEGSSPVASTSRIGPLANLPVFFKLDGKRVVLAGGGEPALWKAELLAATGALVEVFAETFVEGFQELSADPANGQILLVRRGWVAEDFTHAALAVGSFADETEAQAFASAARAFGVPVNVVDRPAFCDFQFGAIVNRSPLVVGISTDGAAPVFGQAVRSLIESVLPDGFRHWVRAAGDLRRAKRPLGDTPDTNRRFWQRFTDLALRNPEGAPSDADIERLLRDEPAASVGEPVTIIHVSGEADTLTIGDIRVLRAADDIFFDETVAPAIMAFARREARRHAVSSGRVGLLAVADAMINAATPGRRVVRLRSGAGSENVDVVREADVLRAAGISVVVVSRG